jgi:hypothetical protein
MTAAMWALVLTQVLSNGQHTDVVIDVFDSQAQCEKVIYEQRYFNGNCYPVEKIIPREELETAAK